MNYWLISITEDTWITTLNNKIYGAPHYIVKNFIKQNDILIFYIMKQKCEKLCEKFVGAFSVDSSWFKDKRPLWLVELKEKKIKYPYRVYLKPIVSTTDTNKGVKLKDVIENLSFIIDKIHYYEYFKFTPANYREPLPEPDAMLIICRLIANIGCNGDEELCKTFNARCLSYTNYVNNDIETLKEDIFKGVYISGEIETLKKTKNSSFLLSFFKAIISNSNLLLIGPPGTGKTEFAKRLAEHFVREEYEVITANSLMFRRHLVGGPSLDQGKEVWKSGVLIRAYNRSCKTFNNKNGSDVNYIIIIDEINRADIDKSLGEFFTIFSDSNPNNWKLPKGLINEIISYGENVDSETRKFINCYRNFGNGPITKIRIIATMNLVDYRNLFHLGEAILRRFHIIRFEYPSNTEDVEEVLRDLNELNEEEKMIIRALIECLRKKFAESNKNSVKSEISFNISPASVKKALLTYVSLNEKERDINTFISILKGTLGSINDDILSEFRKHVDECVKR